MSTLKEMAFEYKQAAAKLAMAIERHKVAGDISEAELKSLTNRRWKIHNYLCPILSISQKSSRKTVNG